MKLNIYTDTYFDPYRVSEAFMAYSTSTRTHQKSIIPPIALRMLLQFIHHYRGITLLFPSSIIPPPPSERIPIPISWIIHIKVTTIIITPIYRLPKLVYLRARKVTAATNLIGAGSPVQRIPKNSFLATNTKPRERVTMTIDGCEELGCDP